MQYNLHNKSEMFSQNSKQLPYRVAWESSLNSHGELECESKNPPTPAVF